ncbi:cholesterol 24-hydroxylase-like isoform X2 [Argopecten irradians]|uniref:cholesterol 24-hydroxylase-like isoform X2 n=1 Tax=Argopecten irradians TaxID=31199 RepID=UPI00371AA988
MLLVEVFGIFTALCVCGIISAAWYLHRQHQRYDHLPGPPRDSSKKYGLIFRICLWNQVLVIILDPVYIKDVLVTGNHPKSKLIYSRSRSIFGARFLGQGLESQIDSKHWILQRMHLDQWFKPHFLRQFASEFNTFADQFVEQLETQADGQTDVKISSLFGKLTMHLLNKIAFNIDLGPLSGDNNIFTEKLKIGLKGFEAATSNPLLAINPFKWRYRQTVRDALNFIRQSAWQTMIERKTAKCRGDYVPRDLLEFIMELKEKHPSEMTDDVLLDNFVTFLIGGQDTSAHTMSFMIFLLGKNPECYKKLQHEIDENVGSVSVISLGEIEKLSYLDMVLKETLRLYPVGKLTARETVKDYSLGGHFLPTETNMIVSFYATSRTKQNIKDPEKFIPERFDFDNSEKFNKYASTPFSTGPHTCIGRKFAEIEMKITIAKIMQNFEFELVPGQSGELDKSSILQMKDGVHCFFRQRQVE